MKHLSTKHRKVLKIVLITAGVLAVFVIGAGIYVSRNLKGIIQERFTEATSGVYTLEIGKLNTNLIRRSVRMSSVRLTTDEVRREQVNRQLDRAYDPLEVSLDNLAVKGIRLRKKHRGAQSIDIVSPQVNIIHTPRTDTGMPKETANPGINPIVKGLGVDRIRITGGNITYSTVRDASDALVLEGVDLTVRDFDMDSAAVSNHQGMMFASATLQITSLRKELNEGAVGLEIDEIDGDLREGRLSVKSIRMVPRIDKSSFAYKVMGNPDWTKVECGEIQCNGVDFPALLNDRVVRIDSISLSDAHIETYKNRKASANNTIKPMYHQMLQRAPVGIDIKRITANNVNVRYDELAQDGITPGVIMFNRINGDLYGVTNMPEQPSVKIRVVASGSLMNAGTLFATFLLPADSTNNTFTVTGKLTDTNLRPLNKMITPLAYIEVESGHISQMNFTINGNDYTSRTHLVMLYEDLDVTILKLKDNGQVKERKFLSDLANGLFLKSSNPDGNQTRQTNTVAQRDPYRSPWNYIWKSIFPGIKETVGMPGARMQQRQLERELAGEDGRGGLIGIITGETPNGVHMTNDSREERGQERRLEREERRQERAERRRELRDGMR